MTYFYFEVTMNGCYFDNVETGSETDLCLRVATDHFQSDNSHLSETGLFQSGYTDISKLVVSIQVIEINN